MSSTAVAPTSQTATQTAAGTKTTTSPLSNAMAVLPPLSLTSTKNTPVSSKIGTPSRVGQQGWIHPRMDEVVRRRNATHFDSSNVKTILASLLLLILSFYIPSLLLCAFSHSLLQAMHPYPNYMIWTLRALLLSSAGVASAPLLRTPDNCEDIPLTPSQRKLLALPPMSRPATPQEQAQYVTPPRFSRSATPRSSTSSVRAEASDSPLGGRGTPLDGYAFRSPSSGSNSPFASLQRTGSGSQSPFGAPQNTSERRRLSYTNARSSPLSESLFDSSGSLTTPTKANKASIGLNNKWLYEKGRGSPRGSPSRSSMFS